MNKATFRLVTQPSFDGLVSAVLLNELGMIREVVFVHPNDMKDGRIVIGPEDITSGLPYTKGAHLAFDHHASEVERFESSGSRWKEDRLNLIIDTTAPSSSRVIHRHFGGQRKLSAVSEAMMTAVDQADNGNYRRSEVLAPRGWTLLNFIIDARTGLEASHSFGLAKEQLLLNLIDICRGQSIDEILRHPDVADRVATYWEEQPDFIDQLERCSHLEGNVAITDLRHQDPIHPGNRFVVYALYPTAAISIQIVRGKDAASTVLAVRKSIFNHRSLAHIGSIMLEFGGGGHDNAGTCQIASNQVMSIMERLVKRLNTAG